MNDRVAKIVAEKAYRAKCSEGFFPKFANSLAMNDVRLRSMKRSNSFLLMSTNWRIISIV